MECRRRHDESAAQPQHWGGRERSQRDLLLHRVPGHDRYESWQTTANREGKVAESVMIAGLFVHAAVESVAMMQRVRPRRRGSASTARRSTALRSRTRLRPPRCTCRLVADRDVARPLGEIVDSNPSRGDTRRVLGFLRMRTSMRRWAASAWRGALTLMLLSTLSSLSIACAGRRGPVASPLGLPPVTNPAIAHGHWKVAPDVRALGWSERGLDAVRDEARKLESAVLLIVTRGQVVLRIGDIRHEYQVHSVRKSLLSALYGIAIDRDQIDPDDTLRELGIDDRGKLTRREKRATVDDLLCARSGVYLESAAETPAMRKKRPARGSHRPGWHWYYNNWDFNVAGTIYEQETGVSLFNAFQREIAGPIGMQDFDLGATRYTTHRATEHRAYKFRLSSRDLARFGQLFLQGGQWNQQQIIPRDWVDESTEPVTKTGRVGSHSGYGRMWWVMVKPGKKSLELGRDAFTASGNGGHRLTVVPAIETLIVHRVDTDDKNSRRMKTREYDRLLATIFRAWRGRAATRVASRLAPMVESIESVESVEMTPDERRVTVERLVALEAALLGDARELVVERSVY